MSATQEPRQRWVGPFEGYIKGTPKDFTGKTKTTFCKTLEEAQTIAQNYDGIVGGITQIKENKFSLRYGNRLFYSPKKEKSWLFLDAKQPKFVDTSPDLPEDEAEWTRDDHEAYDKWEEEENKKLFISKLAMKEDKNEFSPWTYNKRVLLLNPITNEVRDKNTNKKIGTRMVIKDKDKNQDPLEVLVWCVTPYC